jgi:hypothetical protein
MTCARPLAASLALSLVACNAVLDFHEVEDAADVGSDGASDDTAPASCVTVGCPLASLHCEPTSGECVECVADGDCPTSPYPTRCDPDQNLCVACLVDVDCHPGERCILPSHRCARRCDDPIQCKFLPPAYACDLSKGICVECVTDADCAFEKYDHHCEPLSQQCVQCLYDTQCGTRYCDPASFHCVDCVRSSDCDQGKACDPTRHQCVLL